MSYDYEAYDQPLTGNNLDFSEKSIRMGFIRKVYLLLMAQLIVTFGFVCIFTFSDGAKLFVANNQWIIWTSLAGTIVVILALACAENLRRKTPWNFIFLGVFTFFESILVGTASSNYYPNEVLMAIGICAAVTLAITVFAFQTKIDFTVCGGFIFVSLIVLMLFGILAMIFQNKILHIFYSSLGALFFCFYLVVDTQMMVGGTHKYSLSPEEYVFAALNLYLDIINMFLYILRLIGLTRD